MRASASGAHLTRSVVVLSTAPPRTRGLNYRTFKIGKADAGRPRKRRLLVRPCGPSGSRLKTVLEIPATLGGLQAEAVLGVICP